MQDATTTFNKTAPVFTLFSQTWPFLPEEEAAKWFFFKLFLRKP